jgi:putative DNA primase/helicase
VTAPHPPEPQSNGPTLGDIANARRFVQMHGRNVLYVPPWKDKGWLVWDDDRWAHDDTLEVERMAKRMGVAMFIEWSENGAHKDDPIGIEAVRLQKVAGLRALLEVTRSEHTIIALPIELDTHHWLLNTPTGTIDLRTGDLDNAHRNDFITKMTNARYDPRAKCPRWLRFLEEVFVHKDDLHPEFDGQPDRDLIAYIQRLVGYCLTGSVEEHMFAILHGTGRNGKGVFTNTLYNMLGDHSRAADASVLLSKRTEAHPAEIANLQGRRLVTISETDAGRKLAEATVKNLTGGDVISARFLYQDFFDFKPTHKLLLSTNHKPEISGTDEGIWSRIHLIPFNRTFAPQERDPDLEAVLATEWEGILGWAIEGCLIWQAEGLNPPKSVLDATAEYREESDEYRRFIRDCCNVGDEWTKARVSSRSLYQRYESWCRSEGQEPASTTAFGTAMTALGYPSKDEWQPEHKVAMVVRRGISLKDAALL